MDRITISWDKIAKDVALLAKLIHEEYPDLLKDYPRILTVTRGGMIPAALLARHLKIKSIETIGLESYDDKIQKETVSLIKQAHPDFLKNAIIVDDLVDTGRTFDFLRAKTRDCLFAVLYTKPAGKPETDFAVEDFTQDCWIDFPWEVTFSK